MPNDLSEETEYDEMDYMTNGQYKGHVSEIEKLGYIYKTVYFVILVVWKLHLFNYIKVFL